MTYKQSVMLMDNKGKLVAELELPNIPPTPEVIQLHDGRTFMRQIDMRIYRQVACYIVGTKSQALIDHEGELAYSENYGYDANPFGRKTYVDRKAEGYYNQTSEEKTDD